MAHFPLDARCTPDVQPAFMKFHSFLQKFSVADEDAAAALGFSRVSISRMRRELQRPRLDGALRIYWWSRGKVTMHDWADDFDREWQLNNKRFPK
jgi:hypothetical protein